MISPALTSNPSSSSKSGTAASLLPGAASAGTGSSYPATSSTGGSTGSGDSSSAAKSLKPTDFINMMITQLKNQDPLQPTSNSDLLQQMSEIGQLQSQDQLQTSLQNMVLQNQIGAASNFIGKSIQGMDANNKTISGTVNSVHVESGGVNLVLDNGTSLDLSRVTDVVNPTPAGANTSSGSSTTGK